MEQLVQRDILKISENKRFTRPDFLAVEAPLEIQIRYGNLGNRQRKSIAVTMRTPGNDECLAVGFLFSEGIIRERSDVVDVITNSDLSSYVIVDIHPDLALDLGKLERHFYVSSSCGVCGKASVDAVFAEAQYLYPKQTMSVSKNILHQLPSLLREGQDIFEHTGGIHAAGLFSLKGELLYVCEDVGRHNALDKLVGYAFLNDWLPLDNHLVMLSGRSSFELMQKSVMAGVSLVAAVGPPSSLAVRLAEENDMTLVGFLKSDSFNVYSGFQRVTD